MTLTASEPAAAVRAAGALGRRATKAASAPTELLQLLLAAGWQGSWLHDWLPSHELLDVVQGVLQARVAPKGTVLTT